MFLYSSLQPLPRLQSSQLNANVQLLLLAGLFCKINSNRGLARERWQIFFLKKTQYLMNTLYVLEASVPIITAVVRMCLHGRYPIRFCLLQVKETVKSIF